MPGNRLLTAVGSKTSPSCAEGSRDSEQVQGNRHTSQSQKPGPQLTGSVGSPGG